MSFHEDAIFPENLSYGSSFGPFLNAEVTELESGARETVMRWATPLGRFNARWAVRELPDLGTITEFWRLRQGPANGFRFKDHTDFSSASDHTGSPAFGDQIIGTGDGSQTVFQLRKTYGAGGLYPQVVNIRKPISGTVVVGINGVDQSSGWTVNTATGEITFSSAPGSGLDVTAGFQYHVPVQFGADLNWLETAYSFFEGGDIGQDIPIVEIRDPSPVPAEWFAGGSINHGDTASDLSISLLQGRLHVINPTSGGLSIYLPDALLIPTGGIHFILENTAASAPMTVRDSAGTSVGTLAAQSTAFILLALDSSGAKEWRMA